MTATLNPGLSSQQILGTANFNVVLSGDINTDGVLDEADIDAFVAGWLYQQPTGDINSWRKGDLTMDGKVGLSDAFELHQAMLATGAGALDFSRLVTVPEPSVLLLIGIGVLATSCPRSNSRQIYLYLGKCATPFWPRC